MRLHFFVCDENTTRFVLVYWKRKSDSVGAWIWRSLARSEIYTKGYFALAREVYLISALHGFIVRPGAWVAAWDGVNGRTGVAIVYK